MTNKDNYDGSLGNYTIGYKDGFTFTMFTSDWEIGTWDETGEYLTIIPKWHIMPKEDD